MNPSKIDFSTLLASSIHDMKNSVSLLLLSLHDLVAGSPPENELQKKQFASLEYEATRINTDLIQLLTLYRMGEQSISADIDETSIRDLLLDQLARNESLLMGKNISVDLECEADLIWYLDAELIGSVINNLLVNSSRYARNKVKISATVIDGKLCIRVSDDGAGFPESMLTGQSTDTNDSTSRLIGSTKLGLMFAQKILALHSSKGKEGYLVLANRGINGGARIELYLP